MFLSGRKNWNIAKHVKRTLVDWLSFLLVHVAIRRLEFFEKKEQRKDFMGVAIHFFFHSDIHVVVPFFSLLENRSTNHLLRKVLRDRSTIASGEGTVICIIHQSKKKEISKAKRGCQDARLESKRRRSRAKK